MLPELTKRQSIFLETTKDDHKHGGSGWEFGTCLWSPRINAKGSRIYEIMKEPKVGDLILHNYHYIPDGKPKGSYLCGYSYVGEEAKIRNDEPPSPGPWGGRDEYYKVELTDFTKIKNPLCFKTFTANYAERLREEIEYHSPRFFPYAVAGNRVRLNQGMYLARVTPLLFQLIKEALHVEVSSLELESKRDMHRTYAEGERYRREVSYFARNARLAEDVKRKHNYTCQLCGFSPLTSYGKRMREVALECHHLDPFSERKNYCIETKMDDVTVLCANCHRLVHHTRPAMSLEKARKFIRSIKR